MEPKIIVRNKDKNGRNTVYVQVCCSNGIKRIPTGVKVKGDKKSLSTEKKIVKAATEKQQQLINKKLNSVQNVLFKASMDNQHVTKEYLDFNLKKNNDEKNSFFEQYQRFLDSHKNEWVKNTHLKHTRTFTLLKEYCKLCGLSMTYDNVTEDLMRGFTTYLAEEYNYSNSSTKTRISDLKCFLNECLDKGLLKKAEFRKYRPYKGTGNYVDPLVVTVDEKELKIIKNFKIPEKNWKLEFARDFFVLACATGQRYQSLISLKSVNVDGDMLTVHQGKTKKRIIFKMNGLAKEMIQKMVIEAPNGKMKSLNNPKMNAYLKELFRDHIAPKHDCFNTELSKIKYVGSDPIEIIKKKWEWFGIHTGRRSFINIMIHKNVPTKYIRSVTGHSKAEAFMVYENNREREDFYASEFPEV